MPGKTKLYKIVFVGNRGVGKTQLLNRVVKGNFSSNYKSTIAADFLIKTLTNDGEEKKLQLWDTAGEINDSVHSSSLYQGTNLVVLCYAVNDTESLKALNQWHKKIKQFLPDVPFVIFATKSDLAKSPSQESLREKAKELGCIGSAITNANTQAEFDPLFSQLLSLCEGAPLTDNSSNKNSDAAQNQASRNQANAIPFRVNNSLNTVLKNKQQKTRTPWQLVKAHPFGTAFGILLALGVIAIFFIPGVGQILGLAALTSLLVTKVAAIGIGAIAAKIFLTIGFALAALTLPQWLGQTLRVLGFGIRILSEALTYPGRGARKLVDRLISNDKYPNLNKFIGVGLQAILMLATTSPILFIVGKGMELLGLMMAGSKLSPASKFDTMVMNFRNSFFFYSYYFNEGDLGLVEKISQATKKGKRNPNESSSVKMISRLTEGEASQVGETLNGKTSSSQGPTYSSDNKDNSDKNDPERQQQHQESLAKDNGINPELNLDTTTSLCP